jgi:hypothetical protein
MGYSGIVGEEIELGNIRSEAGVEETSGIEFEG